MSRLHDLIKLQRQVDNLERHALTVFGTHKVSEVQQLAELKKSLWARIEGEIDTERERLAEFEYAVNAGNTARQDVPADTLSKWFRYVYTGEK